jgi:hypothetical protein
MENKGRSQAKTTLFQKPVFEILGFLLTDLHLFLRRNFQSEDNLSRPFGMISQTIIPMDDGLSV